MGIDSQRHAGKHALITGAASGIGAATAVRFAAEGATVFAVDVSSAGLDETARTIRASGGTCHTFVADLTVEAEVGRVVDAVKAAGRIDVLANVAGIMDHFYPVAEVDDATWQRVFDVNVTAQMRTCRLVVPLMLEAGGGAIVNVSSLAGVGLGAAGAAYAASKHAVIGLTTSIAYHYALQGIRANVVCPGGTATNIGTTAAPQSELGWRRAELTMARAVRTAEPDEIAALLSWLSCDEASNVSGAVVKSDAGWTSG